MPTSEKRVIGREHPSRSEVAEYVHDMAGQLADMAEEAGLAAAAAALRSARMVLETEF